MAKAKREKGSEQNQDVIKQRTTAQNQKGRLPIRLQFTGKDQMVNTDQQIEHESACC